MTNDLLKIYNEKYVQKYHKNPGKRIKGILSKINFKDSDEILDIGCGNGLLYEELPNNRQNYYGIDFSQAFINECKRKYSGKEGNFICRNVIDFCNENPNKFSKIFMLDFTEHVYDEELINIFKAAANSLKPEGELYIHTPNGDYFLEILKNKGILKQVNGHVAVRNTNKYSKLLKESNFLKQEIKFIPHYNIMRIFNGLKNIPLIGKYFEARILITAKK